MVIKVGICILVVRVYVHVNVCVHDQPKARGVGSWSEWGANSPSHSDVVIIACVRLNYE